MNYLIMNPGNIIFSEEIKQNQFIELLDKIQKLLEVYKEELKPE